MKQMLTFLLVCLISCDNTNGVELIIHNESDKIIDSVTIQTSDRKASIKLRDIKTKEKKSEFLDMTEISKTDGHYAVRINAGGISRKTNIGYYTNGFSLDDTIHIYVRKDTITYTQKIKIVKY